MKGTLVHGCYDPTTFATLQSLGIEAFAFDLRVRSANLVPYRILRDMLTSYRGEEIVLIFGEDSPSTVRSFLDLLKDTGKKLTLEFRDTQAPEYYQNLRQDFYWYFDPRGEWRRILAIPHCQGVILPLRYRELYRDLPELWAMIEDNSLSLWLHAETFAEAEFFDGTHTAPASIDLSTDVHHAYRSVDQAGLRSQKLWRKLNENSAGQ